MDICFFPRASERRVLPIVGFCLSSSHLHIFSSSHPHIFTSSHLHIFSSSHLLIFTFSHHLHTSSHIHILTSSHLRLLPSCPLALLPSHLHIFSSCPLALSFFSYFSSEGGGRGSANETARNATLSHEMRFDRQKLGLFARNEV